MEIAQKIFKLRLFLKLYVVFALLHVLYKILIPMRKRYLSRLYWKHLKGEDMDPFARKVRKYGNRTHELFSDTCIKHAGEDLVRIPVAGPVLACNNARSIKWLLKDEFDNITKPGPKMEMWRLMSMFLGQDGIFVLKHGENFPEEHKKWFSQRKVASLIFTKSNFMTTFYDTFIEKGNRFIRVLEGKENEAVDIQSMFFSFTMDSIEKFFMGKEVNTIEGGMSEFAKNFDRAHHCMLDILTKKIGYILLARLLLPFPFGVLRFEDRVTSSLLLRIVYFFSPTYRKFKKSIKALDDHVYKYVKLTRQDPNLKNRKDVIANFLNSKNGDSLSDKTLRDIVLNLTIAGRDTTACALSWMFFELTQNVDVQKRLQQEIDAKLKGKIPVMSDLESDNLPYLNGVVYETLRLHPPVPNDIKALEKDTTYLDGTKILAGTGLLYSPMAIGRNPEKFPEPLKFQPERWIPFEQPSLYEFPVFQAGPRFCLGKDMAQFEIKLLTVMLLQKFSFTLKEGIADKVTYTLMMTQSITTDSVTRVATSLPVIPSLRK